MSRKILHSSLVFLFITIGFVKNNNAQIISAPNAHTSVATNYTNNSAEDSIFVFCLPQQIYDSVDVELIAVASFANAPYTYTWYKYDPESFIFKEVKKVLASDSDTSEKVIDKQGLYAVKIEKDGSDLMRFDQAWVFKNEPEIDISDIRSESDIKPFELNGLFNNGTVKPYNFPYFNPDTARFWISETTDIEICFTIDHDTVSDLGFYLQSPEDSIIELLPAISIWEQITDLDSNLLNCNVYNLDSIATATIQDFCFTTSDTIVPCVYEIENNLAGHYAPVGDWSVFYGQNPAQKGWIAKLFDCNSNNKGIVRNVSLSFSDTVNDEVIKYNHNLTDADIAITAAPNCSILSLAIDVELPVSRNDTLYLENPYTFVWTAEPFINIPDSTTSMSPWISPYPVFNTRFKLTVTDTFGCVFWDTLYFEPEQSKLALPKYFVADGQQFKPKDGEIALIRQYNIRIYNRYGQLVFESDDPNVGWDGSRKNNNGAKLPSGYYFYVIHAVGWDNHYLPELEPLTNSTLTEEEKLKKDRKREAQVQKGMVYLFQSN